MTVVLVHDGPSIRFLASALTLRLPRIAFEVDAADPRAGAPLRSQTRQTAALVTNIAYTVRIPRSDDLAAAVTSVLNPVRNWRIRRLIVVVEEERRSVLTLAECSRVPNIQFAHFGNPAGWIWIQTPLRRGIRAFRIADLLRMSSPSRTSRPN